MPPTIILDVCSISISIFSILLLLYLLLCLQGLMYPLLLTIVTLFSPNIPSSNGLIASDEANNTSIKSAPLVWIGSEAYA